MRHLLFVLMMVVLSLAVASAQATYTESILYNFGTSANDGSPYTGLVMDSAGNLYGAEFPTSSASGDIYKLTPGGVKSVFHAFTGGSGGSSSGWLTVYNGNVYGTTRDGGNGNGTVFKITSAGVYSTVYKFGNTGSGDGQSPSGPVVFDASGTLYGTTSGGGSGFGTLYKVTTAGKETVLYKFKGGRNGSSPFNNLIRDTQGNLYGISCVTAQGCNGFEVFKVTPGGVKSEVGKLHGVNEGSFIARNSAGDIYGYDYWAGLWEISAQGVYTTHGFGVGAEFKGRLTFANGILYGASAGGGANANFDFYGDGMAFAYDPVANTETTLYNFGANPEDAALPISGVTLDSAGNIYGATELGGANGQGAIFKLTKQ